ncbi:transcription factor 23-like [Ylistrum balloti]|uniref:transcription factor 23-like n=1 Tax=Ylistrum balloti TaxID=509963 RepID=UPI002905BBE6|nr:transcription factor 23-like [Ylistrum balloti]
MAVRYFPRNYPKGLRNTDNRFKFSLQLIIYSYMTVTINMGDVIQQPSSLIFQNSEDQTSNEYDKMEDGCLGRSFLDSNRFQNNQNRPVTFENAARERSRVKTLRGAFLELQRTLPAVPPDTKLSKLDVLVLATTYIAHLMRTLSEDEDENQVFAANGIMHPVKKWPMRSRLYAGILSSTFPVRRRTADNNSQRRTSQNENAHWKCHTRSNEAGYVNHETM